MSHQLIILNGLMKAPVDGIGGVNVFIARI